MEKLVIGLAGPQFSGKSTLAKYACALFDGYIWSASEYLKPIVEARGLPPCRESYNAIATQMSQELGVDFLIDAFLENLDEIPNRLIFFDAVRWPETVPVFRQRVSNFRLLYITASSTLRFHRALGQAKNGRTPIMCVEDFEEEENLPSEREIKDLLPLADFVISTDPFSLMTYQQMASTCESWLAP